MSHCCKGASESNSPRAMHGAREILAWALPGIALIFVPKCPACLAAYVALWTGLGMSFATATYLRWIWLSLCLGSLLFLAITRLRSRLANNGNFKNTETES
jgi:hypothetical protein